MEEIEEHIWLCTTQTVLDDGVSADKKKDSPLLLLLLLRSSLVCVLLVALLLLLSVYCIDVYSLVAVHRELSCTYREPCSSPKRRDEKLIYQKEKQLGKCPTLGSSQLENPFFYTILYTPFFPFGLDIFPHLPFACCCPALFSYLPLSILWHQSYNAHFLLSHVQVTPTTI